MMTKLIKYHSKTEEVALFNSDGEYWIGSYNPYLTHQNVGEPMYSFIRGYWYTEDEGVAVLQTLTGNEF